jgi:hypothetical protein
MKQYVLVAGFDSNMGGVDFGPFCDRRMAQVIAKNPNVDLKFIIGKFKEGTLESREITYTNGTKTDSGMKTINTFDKITTRNYIGNDFKNGQRNTLSITHIYDAISDIGTSKPNTLQEFSLYSHSWEEGPVLVNSFDDRSTKYTGAPGTLPPPSQIDITDVNQRDPDDKDCRTKDFSSPTMDVNTFKKAYSDDGYSWVWGCLADDEFRDLIHGIIKDPKYNGAATKDDVKFTFYTKYFPTIFNKFAGLPLTAKSTTITFADVKKVLCKGLQNSYAFNLAKNTGRKAYAALAGSGAEYESGTNGLMKIDPNRIKVVNFYKTHLGIKTDPENRNYGEYLPTLTCTALPSAP